MARSDWSGFSAKRLAQGQATKLLRPSGDAERTELRLSPAFIEFGDAMLPLNKGLKVRLGFGSGIVLALLEGGVMRAPPHGVQAFLYTQATDMPTGFHGLSKPQESV